MGVIPIYLTYIFIRESIKYYFKIFKDFKYIISLN